MHTRDPIPEGVTRYQSDQGYGYEEPVSVGEWLWSGTFGQWGRTVTFANGWTGYTWPEPEWQRQRRENPSEE